MSKFENIKQKKLKKLIKQLNSEYSGQWNHRYVFNGIQTRNYDVVVWPGKHRKAKHGPGKKEKLANNELKWRKISEILSKLETKGKTVLDIGCSDGYFTIQTLKNFKVKHVEGIDIDSKCIERANFAKEFLKVDKVNFSKCDIHDEKLKEYDIILALGIVHRVPNMESFLEKVTEIGKKIIIETKVINPNNRNRARVIDPYMSINHNGQTKTNIYNGLYTVTTVLNIAKMLKKYNFEIIEQKVYERQWNIHGEKVSLNYPRAIIVASKKEN